MGLNEREIDMTNYKLVEEDDPIIDMRIVDVKGETMSDLVATVFIKMRVFVANQEAAEKGQSYKGLWGGSKGRQMVFDYYVMFSKRGNVVKVLKSEIEDGMGMNQNYLDYWKKIVGDVSFKEAQSVEYVMNRIYQGYLQLLADDDVNIEMAAKKRMNKNIRKLEDMLDNAFREYIRAKQSNPQRVKEPEVKKEPEIDNTPKNNNDMWTSTSSWASE